MIIIFYIIPWPSQPASSFSSFSRQAGAPSHYATAGTYVGLRIEERLAIGVVLLRVITQKDASPLVACLRADEFGVTCIDGEGKSGPVTIIFIIVDRTDLSRVIDMIREHNPGAFYSVEDVRSVSRGYFPAHGSQRLRIQRR